MLKKLTSAGVVVALAAALALAMPGAASGSGATTLVASPGAIAIGETARITATDLGDLQTAYFGLDGTPGGQLAPEGTTDWTTSVDAPVIDSRAVVEFSATAPGTFTIAVSDGETPIATTTVTVTETPAEAASVTAAQTSIAVGETTTVTAQGLGGLETAFFGLGGNGSGGQLAPEGSTSWSTSVEAAVSGGSAVVEFSATEAGSFTVAVSDGETPLAQTSITVVDASTPTATPTPSPTAAPASGDFPLTLVLVIIVAVVLIVAAIVLVVVLQRRRKEGEQQ